jgi:hypothetical protein
LIEFSETSFVFPRQRSANEATLYNTQHHHMQINILQGEFIPLDWLRLPSARESARVHLIYENIISASHAHTHKYSQVHAGARRRVRVFIYGVTPGEINSGTATGFGDLILYLITSRGWRLLQ